MSAPAAPPAEPIAPISPISFEEIQGTPTPPPQAPAAPAPAAPAPASPEPAKANVLENIFGAPKEPVPDNPNPEPPANDEPTDGDKGVPAKLREELARTKKEAREQADRLRQEREELARQNAELAEQFDAFRREVSVTDPTQAPEVLEASGNLSRQIGAISKTLPPTVARAFLSKAKGFIDAYGQLGEITDQGYDNRHEELSRALAKEFGAHSDEIMRTLPSLNDMAEKVKGAVASASSSSGDVLTHRAYKAHNEANKMFDEVVGATLSFSDELAKADPYSARNIISSLIAQTPEFAEKSKQLTEYLRSGLVPPAPLSPEAEIGMTPEQRRAAVMAQSQNFSQTSQNIYANTPLAFHSQLALGQITQMYVELKHKYEAIVSSSPSPSRTSGADIQNPGEPAPAPINGVRPITMEEIVNQPS